MATYYVGTGGSDANAGTSYALRKLTLAGVEAVATSPGDIAWLTPGTYRESVTLGASGGNTYSTGTITVTNGSTTVTGSGTTFTGGNVVAGYYLKTPTGATYLISAVNSATEIILAYAYDGVTTAGASYITYNPIKWYGDYTGANTDGVGGLIRITGSNDDISGARSNSIVATSKNYRHFDMIKFDMTTSSPISMTTCQYWLINRCHFGELTTTSAGNATGMITTSGATLAGTTVNACYFGGGWNTGVVVSHSSTVTGAGVIVQNSIFQGMASSDGSSQQVSGVTFSKVSGCIVKNCSFLSCGCGVGVVSALSVGTSNSVVNNLFKDQNGTGGVNPSALYGTTSGEILEDFNTFFNCRTNRTNTAVGANSVGYPPQFDSRPFFERVK